jgi:hypothetical protein
MLSVGSLHCARLAIPIALSAFVCACGGGSGSDPRPQPLQARPVPQSNLEIADLLYTDGARTPSGFYSEATAATSYTATFHIKNSDVTTPSSPSEPTFELCTDDWNVALAWSETVALAAPVYSDLSATDSNEHFFQFARVPRSASLGAQQMRVYRCDFLDRVGVDLRRVSGAAGHVNKRPVSGTDLRWIVEYLWRFSSYNNVDNAVLKSAPVSDAGDPAHELTLAQLTRNAGANGCDRVRVFAWRYRANTTSGQLLSELRDLWSFDARNESGSTRLCGS